MVANKSMLTAFASPKPAANRSVLLLVARFSLHMFGAAGFLLASHSNLLAQTPDDVIPGNVRLDNGLILRGLCTSGASISGAPARASRLNLMKIDQDFRSYFVGSSLSGPIVPDNAAIPATDYRIIQKAIRRKPLPFAIGLHAKNPFQPDGRSHVELMFAQGKAVKIDVGIIRLNSRFANVRGLTHNWIYGVSLGALPDATLYAGHDQPGIVKLVKGFDDGETQLNLAHMLMQGKKYIAAQTLLRDISNQFPDLQQRCDRSIGLWNDQFGDSVVAELQHMKAVGKYDIASAYARKWPDAKLDPVVRVRAKQFIEELDEEARRLQVISVSLDKLLASINAKAARRDATQMITELKKKLDTNTLPQFAAYELVWQDDGLTAEAKIALATTGWLLGADNAIDEFPEAFGLFQIRYLLSDYLKTTTNEARARDDLRREIQATEGYSVERVAMLLRHLPADGSVELPTGPKDEARRFSIDSTDSSTGCVGQTPAEYVDTREYPLLIAFPYGGGTSEVVMRLWGAYADRHGYILAAPELLNPMDGGYDASAAQHQQMLGLIRRLKRGFSVDSDRVFIAGHDIGADVAMDIATAHPDLFAGVIPIAGIGRKHLLWTVQNSSRLPWYVIAGTRQPHYATELMPLLNKLFTRVPSPGRRDFCNAMVVTYPERGVEAYDEEFPTLFEWMGLQKRTAPSDRIHVTTLRSTDRSWNWIGLESIEPRFVSLDEPNSRDDRPDARGNLQAEINESGNVIRVKSLPGDAFIRFSPDIPELDLNKTIRISNNGRRQQVDYQPSLKDLLEDFRERRDTSRFCFMKVPIGG